MTDHWLLPVGLLIALLATATVAHVRFRRTRRPKVQAFRFNKPVPEELQLVFGGYAGNVPIGGLICKNDGIYVGFADGQQIRFIPVPDGETLYAEKGTGELKVTGNA